MTHIVLSIAPVFLLIVIGHLLRRNGIPDVEFWNLNDRLVYWVLIPCLLFYKTSTLDLDLARAAPFVATVLGGFSVAAIVSLAAAKATRLPNPVASSVLQGGARHNTFVALAIAERVYGSEGLSIAALATATLIPVTNISMVTAMVALHGNGRDGGFLLPIARDLGRNPLLLSVVLGLGCNLAGVGEIPVLHDTFALLGAAALPIVLLCVGANIHLKTMKASALPMALAAAGKLAVFPLAVVLLAAAFDLSMLETMVALIFGAVPTASSAYTLARQMGGDAPLMAAIVAVQTAVSFVTLPLTMSLAQYILS